MTSKAQASGFDSSSPSHEHEARLLVELLRSSRLSLLYGEAGADKTALLRSGLMPLLSRRTSDTLVPAAVRASASGVVVPFPDRRRRLSGRVAKGRREIVVYFDEWTDTPLASLRDVLYRATGTGAADQLAPSMRLGEILEDLSTRLDARFIVLLDRFENLLEPPSPGFGAFSNELAEAVRSAELPASFLIAVSAEARPRLTSLQARIPGFDDFSLRLAPPRDFKPLAAPRIVKSASPTPSDAAIETDAPPVLTEALATPPSARLPHPASVFAPIDRAPGRPKVKNPPLPRLQVTTADVYAMIEQALSRIAARAVSEARPAEGLDAAVQGFGRAAVLPSAGGSGARMHGNDLRSAIEKMERRLGVPPGSADDS